MSDTVVQFRPKNDLTGTTLGQYRILQHIGRGGMADVYKAEHIGLSVFRTIKVVRPEFVADKEFSARFKTEAQAVAMLRHNNIVQLQDFCFEKDMFYMVMEFVDGQNLMECISEAGPIRPVETAVHLVSQIAAALHYAHSQGLIHRDIKPQNILLDSSGVPILTDFGIAKLLESNSELTRTGSSIGTPNYMAPEQARGGGNIGPAADVYSLAVVLYEILTGVAPFDAPTPMATLMKAMHEPVPPPQQFCAEISDELQEVILTGMARDPQDRYITALHFQRALENTLRADNSQKLASITSRKGRAQSLGRARKRHRSDFKAPLIGAAAGLVVVGLVAAGFWLANNLAPEASQPAERSVVESGRIVRDDEPAPPLTRLPPPEEIKPRYEQRQPVEEQRAEPDQAADIPPIVQGGKIAFDDYVERLIEHPGQQVHYSFLAEAGQSVYFDSRHNSRNATRYTLLAPDQKTSVFTSDVDAGPWQLPQTGSYTLVVDPLVERSVLVEFVIWHLDPAVIDGGELEPDTVIDSAVERPGQQARYQFTGEQGQSVYLESRQDDRFRVNYRLMASAGERQVFSSSGSTGRVVLPQTGAYSLLVHPENTYRYRFLLRLE